ncbi:MAG: DUF3854 domain-containing protein, partial [Gemmataceae bacterium]|nr:DUF3854 domain-containing protein [Gemmataceae bacterium]
MTDTLPTGSDEGKLDHLLPRHLDDLRKSGLTDDTIRASRVRSVTDPRQVAHLLGDYLTAAAARALGPCLAFPFLDVRGEVVTWAPAGGKGGTATRPFARLKPDSPRTRGGKAAKYESPRGGGNRAYLPPGVGALLADPTCELVIVEGEKKALAGTQHGFPTVGLSGVWNWTLKRAKDPATGRGTGPRELIPDLAAVNWSGRPVTIVFDSDLADKPAVAWARWHLAQTLAARGAEVRVVDLPAGDGAKCGLDDFLLAHGPDA